MAERGESGDVGGVGVVTVGDEVVDRGQGWGVLVGDRAESELAGWPDRGEQGYLDRWLYTAKARRGGGVSSPSARSQRRLAGTSRGSSRAAGGKGVSGAPAEGSGEILVMGAAGG